IERVPPNPDAHPAACETSSGNAFFRAQSVSTVPRLFGVWSGEQGAGPPEAMAVLVDGRLALGPKSTCSRAGVYLLKGKHAFVLREWTLTGFGPPTRLAFEL